MSGVGRFDWRYELDSINRGLDRDLQQQTGQSVPWFVFDSANTVVDDIYDVGNWTGGVGRAWKNPVVVPVLDAIKVEASEQANSRGLYTVDTIRLVLSPDALRAAGLEDVVLNPDRHTVDRLVYENKVFDINEVRIRGRLKGAYSYTVAAVEGVQAKHEELVNDALFQKYIPFDYT